MTEISVAEYQSADSELQARRLAWRREETDLMMIRDRQLRSLVGTRRGGVTATARALGVSDAQILRLLNEGTIRAVRSALDTAGISRTSYQLTHQRGGRSVGVVVLGDLSPDAVISAIAGHADLQFDSQRPVSRTSTETVRWGKLRHLKLTAQHVLAEAGISSRTYQLADRRGDHAVRLTFTSVMDGLGEPTRQRFVDLLSSGGISVTVDDDGSLMLGGQCDDSDAVQELVFCWQ